ncbi:MAG: HAMP domain-containing histidine kinase [Flavobacteriales bacterium]|nr:HAMP domain-containing histidine kinase [Flavobacteriales bacterium]MDW8431826.1 HAMP domain-containing sensor histidine kinase [Flavobacteriales bacterium]
MKTRNIRFILVFGAFCITALLLVQAYYLKKAYDFSATAFNDKVSLALISVADRIHKESGEPLPSVEAVQQVTSDYFTINVADTVSHLFLENILRLEFSRYGIEAGYAFVMYDCFADSIIWREYQLPGSAEAPNFFENLIINKKDFPIHELPRDSHKIGVYFPDKNKYIFSQIQVLTFASVVVAVFVIFFIYVLLVVLKQKKLSEMKADFVNNMTHEFKTPLSTILLSAETLANPKNIVQSERVQRYAGIIAEEARRLKLHAEKILETAILDAEKPILRKSVFQAHDYIERAAENLRVRVEERKGTLTVHLRAEKDTLLADREHFRNVIYNVLENALKYSKEIPEISVETFNTGNKFLSIRIRDKGIGIPKRLRRQIFNKFVRGVAGDVQQVKGFGLGLYYVRRIIQLHGGRIDVESRVGEGSSFTLHFPLAKG